MKNIDLCANMMKLKINIIHLVYNNNILFDI